MKTIFVGNLDFGTTAASIRSLFEPHGTVEDVKLITDRGTGASRGFAFVEMADPEASLAIAALDGTIVDGRAIKVNEGRPKLDRSAAPPERRVPRI